MSAWAVVRHSDGSYQWITGRELIVGSADDATIRCERLCARHLAIRYPDDRVQWPQLELLCRTPHGSARVGSEDDEDAVLLNEERGRALDALVGGASLMLREPGAEKPLCFKFSFVAHLPDADGRFEWLEVLGVGSQAEVKRVRDRLTGREYAGKIFHKSTVLGRGHTVAQALSECVTTERDVLKTLRHPNIVSLHETIDSPRCLCLILDLCEGGDLFELLSSRAARGDPPPPEDEVRGMFRQMAEAVGYLHRHHVAHRDIAPKNFLLAPPAPGEVVPHVLLTDFGTAKMFGAHHLMHRVVYTPLYVAPEMLEHRAQGFNSAGYCETIDVWSLGVVLYNLATLTMPFASVEEILAGRFDASLIVNSSPLRDLLSAMLTVDPARRITMDGVLEHPWLLVRDTKRLRKDDTQ